MERKVYTAVVNEDGSLRIQTADLSPGTVVEVVVQDQTEGIAETPAPYRPVSKPAQWVGDGVDIQREIRGECDLTRL